MTKRSFIASMLAVAVLGLPGAAPAATEPRALCDALDPAHCMLPFPNDHFTTADATTDTGLRIDFSPLEMPRGLGIKPIDPTEWNRNDGYSPGSMLLTFVPGLDLHQTWGATTDHITDIGRFEDEDAPILVIDADTGERWPFWSELDTNAQTSDDERLLIVRPAVNFTEGHRYLVALRNMKDASGATIPAGDTFAAYRDNAPVGLLDEGRQAEVSGIIDEIEAAEDGQGNAFDRSELFLAWDFTIASERNLSERALHIRDDALAQLGDTTPGDGIVQGTSPLFSVTTVTDRSTDGARLKQIEGTITVPNYLSLPPSPPARRDPSGTLPIQSIPGGRFVYGPDGLPMRNPILPSIDVPFVCTVPKTALVEPARPTLYGHGLLGSMFESAGGSTDRIRERGYMPCATNWMGFAEYDIANAVVTLADPSNMPSMIDRSQQGFVNWTYLARAIVHEDGFAAHPAFQDGAGEAQFRTGELVYDGNSQGAIMGGALVALSVDLTRGVLGVPGMNYSTLLNRSVDWEGPLVPDGVGLPSYSSVLYTMFPDKKEQQVVMAIIQMLWDRGESNGYAAHMTDDPLANTPAHQIMLHVALGDFQVANVSAEVEARTIGAHVIDTALMDGRHWEADPFWNLPTLVSPHAGSALVYWDSGNLTPPNGNVPPLLTGGDPHEDPRRDPRSGDQKAIFWQTGTVVDVFDGDPYLLCRPGQEANIPRVPSLFTIDWCVA